MWRCGFVVVPPIFLSSSVFFVNVFWTYVLVLAADIHYFTPLHKHLLFAVKYVTIALLNKGDGGYMPLPDALQPDLHGLCPTVAAFCGGVFRFARRQRRFGKRAAVPTAYQGKTN